MNKEVVNELQEFRKEVAKRRYELGQVITFNSEHYKYYKNKIEAFDEVLAMIDKRLDKLKKG